MSAPFADIFAQEDRRVESSLPVGHRESFLQLPFQGSATTNSDPDVFYAATQMKNALEIMHELGGESHVLRAPEQYLENLVNPFSGVDTDQKAILTMTVITPLLPLLADAASKYVGKGLFSQSVREPAYLQGFSHPHAHELLLSYLADVWEARLINLIALGSHTFSSTTPLRWPRRHKQLTDWHSIYSR